MVSPPSRGSRKAGAFAPSARADAGAPDFNCFDGALCDSFAAVFAGRLAALLPDLLAATFRVFAAGFWADVPEVGGPPSWRRVWRISCAFSWTYAFLSSLSADQSW